MLLPLMALCLAGCHPEEDKSLRIDGQNFPDDVFRSYLTENFDLDGNGVLDEDEILAVDSINVRKDYHSSFSGDIYTLDMIDRFENLRYLDCYGHQIKKLDLSQNKALVYLRCGNNPLANLNVSGCLSLRSLQCVSSNLKELDLSKNAALEQLTIGGSMASLDLKGCELLEYLEVRSDQLTSLDVSGCTALAYLDCSYNNQLTSLDVSGCTALVSLDCRDNQLTALDVSQNTALEYLDCGNNLLAALDVSGCAALDHLGCYENQLTALDVSQNTALEYLNCGVNLLAALDVSGCTALEYLRCSDNPLTALDVSGCAALTSLDCDNNQLTSLDLSKNTALGYLHCSGNEYHVTAMLNMFDLNQLPEGFDRSKVIDWNGGTVEGTVLTFTQPEVTYTYDTEYAGEAWPVLYVDFTLVCDNYETK